MDATPSFGLPADAARGIPDTLPAPLTVRAARFAWGGRTFVMGILNVTPDSFSRDGLLRDNDDPLASAVAKAARMAEEAADLLDIGGESSRPGHAPVSEEDELARTIPVVKAVRARLPRMPISIDTIKPGVASAALDAGADIVNDVWGVGPSDAMARLAADRRVPYVVMHNREEARYRSVVAEVIGDLSRALDRALAAGCAWDSLIIDPGMGFGKTPEQNLALLHDLDALRVIGRPILLGASRKSTIGKVLDLPADQRLEGTLALTALAVRSGVDLVRVHDVRANVRVARMADAVVRGGWQDPLTTTLGAGAGA